CVLTDMYASYYALHHCLSSLSCPHHCTTDISTLSLHDALPISGWCRCCWPAHAAGPVACLSNPYLSSFICLDILSASPGTGPVRSEEHTSELQSRFDLVCRLLLEKKKVTNLYIAKAAVGVEAIN